MQAQHAHKPQPAPAHGAHPGGGGQPATVWRIFGLAIVIIVFAAVTIGELFLLKEMGFDVITTLKGTLDKGDIGTFSLEASGVAAFVIAQPIVLVALLIWLMRSAAYPLAARLTHIMTGFLPQM